jgi:3-hydroxymyristoyl/3-hydroxydecanoyl-(acyl carrier protein) dehydratase
VEHFGNLFFVLDQPFLAMEVLKFVKPIEPGHELTLMLNWDAATNKLQFSFHADHAVYSSGRLIYAAKSLTS